MTVIALHDILILNLQTRRYNMSNIQITKNESFTMTKATNQIFAMYLKWIKTCAKYLEAFLVEPPINLDFSFTKDSTLDLRLTSETCPAY